MTLDEQPPPPVTDDDDQDRCCWTRRRRRDHFDFPSDTCDEPRGTAHCDEPMATHRDPSPAVDRPRMAPCKSDAMSLFERLGLSELELLLEVVQGAGQQVSGCIPAPLERPAPDDVIVARPTAPHRLCWLLYRWTLSDNAEGHRHPPADVDCLLELNLKSMPGCAGLTESNVCCNPYHWSRPVLAPLSPSSK